MDHAAVFHLLRFSCNADHRVIAHLCRIRTVITDAVTADAVPSDSVIAPRLMAPPVMAPDLMG
jgi:hypothetical protein